VSPLASKLAARIRAEGPVTVAEFMAAALGDPEHGYYRHRNPFGVQGDFITAPEVSQMFGELLGLWLAMTWHQTGSPAPVDVIELGPGRGTLMADAWRAARRIPGFTDAARVTLIETSDRLREVQAQTVGALIPAPRWSDRFAGTAEGPLLLIANEFFDALPIHQFERSAAGWCERLITVGDGDGGLDFTLGAPLPAEPPYLPARSKDAPPGSVWECCPQALEVVGEIARHLEAQGGAAIIIDYGHGRSAVGDTLQAVKDHQYHPVLEDVGAADLTAHVDFEALAYAAKQAGAAVHGPIPQGVFLRALGIEVRHRMLRENATEPQQVQLDAALNRLIGADEMGTLFKVMALTPEGAPPPEGFEAHV